MKITKDDYEKLKTLMRPVVREHSARHRQWLSEEGRAQDVEQRLRWDLFRVVWRNTREGILARLYRYLTDDHIDTALRKIMQELETEGQWGHS